MLEPAQGSAKSHFSLPACPAGQHRPSPAGKRPSIRARIDLVEKKMEGRVAIPTEGSGGSRPPESICSHLSLTPRHRR